MISRNYVEYIVDLLSPFGAITVKSMFGGYGIYKDQIIIAIIIDDELYFKVDQTNKQQYEDYDSTPFTYNAKGRKVVMSYWKVPIDIMEDEVLLSEWVEQSFLVSLKKHKL